MRIKPDRLVERLDQTANSTATEAANMLRGLVEETRAINRVELLTWTATCPRGCTLEAADGGPREVLDRARAG